MNLTKKTILYLVTEDWYFCSHRLPAARKARDAGARVVVVTRIRNHAAEILAEGFELYPIEIDRIRLNFFKDFKNYRQILTYYRKLRPDLVHHIAIKPVLYGSIAAIRCKIPATVNAMAGLGFIFISTSMKARLIRPIIKWIFYHLNIRPNSRIILQNADDMDFFEKNIGIPKPQLQLIQGSGVDIQAFQPKKEPDQKPIIAICAARMLWDKGIAELVEAARLLRQRNIAILIRLAGSSDSNPSAIPEKTLAQWRAEGNVEILGPRNDIAALINNSHIAVLPSYREGLPKFLLEAASCGRPLVATNVPGCRQICRSSETGLLVPPKDPVKLADALEKLAQDGPLRRKLGTGARRLVETTFSEEIIAEETVSLYSKLLHV